MIYWAAKEVLLNLVTALDSAVPYLHFEQINVFLTSGFFIPLVLFLIRSVSVEVSLNCISRIQFKCSFY